jgi:hypothetical protein
MNQTAEAAGLTLQEFYRWMAASGTQGLPECQQLAVAIGRTLDDQEEKTLAGIEAAAVAGDTEAQAWLAERARGVAAVAARQAHRRKLD